MKHDSRHSVTRRVSKTLVQIFVSLIYMALFIGGMVFIVIYIAPGVANWAHGLTNSAIPVMLTITVLAGTLLLITLLYQHEDRGSKFLSKRGYKYLLCFLTLVFILPMFITKNIDVDKLNISEAYLLFFDVSAVFFNLFFLAWITFSFLTFFCNKQVEQQG